eukprot:TRINITY_DN14325_c0_g1_i2.p1 TRINITY_DN14325_c0_g1~~TRINITY_DN14325_c0_g1_i2.p1  ORF type:complete len:714 (+),score=249.29 TRINITY_DN14325_c0_g1_i2:294-2435(+)
MSELVPSTKQSWSSGGTAGILPAERARASFDVAELRATLFGGKKSVAKREFILSPQKKWSVPQLKRYEMDRQELMMASVRDTIGIHKPYMLKGWKPSGDEIAWMSMMATNTGPIMPHLSLFMTTLIAQASNKQSMLWVPKALRFEIIGCYAQTELGHGSNVRGLQTTAEYDEAAQEFVINTPTLQSIKWWNSNIGLTATHCVLYAQLVHRGKELGPHVFFVQVRDENHRALPGVELGDCGPKLGDDAIDTGFARFRNLRIPRVHMLAKRAYIDEDGNYVKGGGGAKAQRSAGVAEKLHYLTMMSARSGMCAIASAKLQIAVTIATRYSLVRHQGFSDSRQGQSFHAAERQILDYQVQSFRVLRQTALAYALSFTGRWMTRRFRELYGAIAAGKLEAGEDLPEVHASSAGLKAMSGMLASHGMEDLRKCCGGHGYLLSAGIGPAWADWVWQVTAEGDPVVMYLQTARFLIKSVAAARKGEKLSGLCEYLSPLRDPGFDAASLRPAEAATPEAVQDLGFIRSLFRARAAASVISAERQVAEELAAGSKWDQAWNGCAQALCTASEHHCFYFLVCKFVDTIAEVADPHCRAVLERLARLLGLAEVVSGSGWVGIVGPATLGAAERATRRLLQELRPDACALADAFSIPDRVLNSTLGREDGNVYEALYEHARSYSLNQKGPFKGYTEYLRPHLDLEFLKLRNRPTPGLVKKGKAKL